MTILLVDSFNRTAADLSASPASRWSLPTGTGTNAWGIDGQYAKSAATYTSNTRGQVRWISTSPGVDYGEVSIRFRRATGDVNEVGLLARCHRTTPTTHNRLAFVMNEGASPDRFELRYYTAYSTYSVIAQVDASAVGATIDTEFHTMRFRFRQLGASTSTTLTLDAWYDGIIVFAAVTWPDFFVGLSGGLSAFRGFGFEMLSAALTWTASDYLLVDDATFDDLSTPLVDPAPSLAADVAITPITLADEGTAVSTLPITPSWGERVTKRWFTARTPTHAGYEVTWARHQIGRRTWAVTHRAITGTAMDTLATFLDSHKGPETPFEFTTHADEDVTVHFLDGTFQTTMLKGGPTAAEQIWTVEYVLEEIR